MEGCIFNIMKYSIHDGPGIRTTVFMKGCPLRCPWCHNPESQKTNPQIMRFPDRCIGCGGCVRICPAGAIALEDKRIRIDRQKCINCGKCSEACYAEPWRWQAGSWPQKSYEGSGEGLHLYENQGRSYILRWRAFLRPDFYWTCLRVAKIRAYIRQLIPVAL